MTGTSFTIFYFLLLLNARCNAQCRINLTFSFPWYSLKTNVIIIKLLIINFQYIRLTTTMPDQAFECTSCSKVIRTTYDSNLHPLLDCLLCRRCYQNYGSGDFSAFDDGIDSSGDDNYCRWCCDGGNLYGCMNVIDGQRCHYSFCEDCIKKNVPNDIVLRINELPDGEQKGVRWHCYVCDKSKIAGLRKEALLAMELLNKNEKKNKTDPEPSPAKKKRTSEQQPQPVVTANTAVVDTATPESTTTPAKTPSTSAKAAATAAAPESTTPASSKKTTTTPARVPASATPESTTAATKKTSAISVKPPTTATPESTTTTSSSKTTTTTTASAKILTNSTTKIAANTTAKVPTTSSAKTTIDFNKPMPLSKKKALLSNSVRLTDLPMNEEPIKTKDTQNSKDLKSHSQPDSASKKHNNQPPKPKDFTPVTHAPPRKDPKSSTIEVIETNRKDNSKSMQAHSRKDGSEVSKRLPSKEVALNKSELQARLDVYRRTKDACIEEIGGNFEKIIEMMLSKDTEDKSRRRIVDMKIDGLKKPMQEFDFMVNDLKRLSQTLWG